MVVYDLVKNHQPLTVNAEETVLEVARRMVEANIGAVPVMSQGALVGIFSERDLMRRVVVAGRDPALTQVREVLTRDLTTVSPCESLDNCMALMKEHNIRHLPICEAGKLRGVVSLRDILLHDVEEKDDELQAIRAYMQTGS